MAEELTKQLKEHFDIHNKKYEKVQKIIPKLYILSLEELDEIEILLKEKTKQKIN